MPLNLQKNLPAVELLKKEHIFVMDSLRASEQDIRPLRVVVLNLMPLKITTETDLVRLLSNTPLQVELDFMKIKGHTPKNTPIEHMKEFYKDFDEMQDDFYDGMIITGAPVEQMPFEEVNYWEEVTEMFGVFRHTLREPYVPIFRGFDDEFYVPHSRHTEIRREDVMKVPDLTLLSESEESGVYMAMARGGREFFITGHSEYSPYTLNDEYMRDVNKGLPIAVPRNYYRNNNPALGPVVRWRGHANLLFTNWLNYYVYQETPFRIEDISKLGDL